MCSDTSTWFNAVEALDGTGPGPSPLDMKLADISALLTPQFFPEDADIATKQVLARKSCLAPALRNQQRQSGFGQAKGFRRCDCGTQRARVTPWLRICNHCTPVMFFVRCALLQ
jgi:hypothetical protein